MFMFYGYFNFNVHWPTGRWGWWGWRRHWWGFYRGDQRWSPPDYPAFVQVTQPDLAHWQTVMQRPLYVEALARRAPTNNELGMQPPTAAFSESTVAAALVQVDPRRDDDTAYLALLRCANDEETLERLLDAAMTFAGEFGCTRLVGPTGLLPAWQAGALVNHFHQTPPLHTPYNPPYLPDVLSSVMEPWQESRLYCYTVARASPAAPVPASLAPFDLARLPDDYLDLLNAALAMDENEPPLDRAAAALLVRLLAPYPTVGWVASVDGEPAGLAVVQPDLADVMRRAGGGRPWHGRAFLAWARRRPAQQGRLVLGAVAPQWRGRGIGRQLWRQVIDYARVAGWAEISIGPVATDSAGARFLAAQGAVPVQRYTTYVWSTW